MLKDAGIIIRAEKELRGLDEEEEAINNSQRGMQRIFQVFGEMDGELRGFRKCMNNIWSHLE